jgi:hypothetical protein
MRILKVSVGNVEINGYIRILYSRKQSETDLEILKG